MGDIPYVASLRLFWRCPGERKGIAMAVTSGTRTEVRGNVERSEEPRVGPQGRGGFAELSRRSRSEPEDDVLRAAAGDGAAFERLVRKHQDDIYSAAYYFLGNADDAADVAQEAFVKAYRGLSGFHGHASFRTWLLTITLNCARSLRTRFRAKKRSAKVISIHADPGAGGQGARGRGADSAEGGLEIADPDASATPAAILERKEVKEALERAIADLDEPSRQVVVLRDLQGESYEAISSALELPLGTVKSRVHRARLELQAKLRPWL